MPSLEELHQAVQATLASKRLGKPVFVRYLVQGADRPEAVLPRLSQAAAVVRGWLGQPLERVHAIGSVDSGQVALTLQFRDGATALVSFARSQPLGDGVDLMVLGNHGALYHDAGSAVLYPEPLDAGKQPDAALLAVIERALKTGKPEAAGTEAKP